MDSTLDSADYTDACESPNEYEQARSQNLQRNLQELQELGLNCTPNIDCRRQKSSHTPTKRKLKYDNQEAINLRRSARSRVKRQMFHNEDYSEKAVAQRQLMSKHEIMHINLELETVENKLIDKLTKEAHLKSLELKEARERALDMAFQNVEGPEKAKLAAKRRRLRRIEKFEADYDLLWIPKGSRCKLTWRIEYRDECKGAQDQIYIMNELPSYIDAVCAYSPLHAVLDELKAFLKPLFTENEWKSCGICKLSPSIVREEIFARNILTINMLVAGICNYVGKQLFPDIKKQEERQLLLGSKSFENWFSERYSYHLKACCKLNSKRKTRRSWRRKEKRGLLQKDFYAVLVQSEKNKREHLYVVTDALRETAHELPNGKSITGTAYWTMARDIQPGVYTLEVASRVGGICATTKPFRITETFCMEEDYSTVGVWCICEEVHASMSGGQWVACSTCNSWHHWACYEKPDTSKIKRLKEIVSHLQTSFFYPKFNTRKTKSAQEELRRIFEMQAGGLELQIIGHERAKKFPAKNEIFSCWMCFDFSAFEDTVDYLESPIRYLNLAVDDFNTVKTVRMIKMINKASGGYKRLKLAEVGNPAAEDGKRLYCTPHNVVCFLRTLLDDRLRKGNKCIDLGAGTGNLSSVLPKGAEAVEIEPQRFKYGKSRLPSLKWSLEDILDPTFYSTRANKYDIIVSNPDFEVALPFIVVGFHLLNRSNPNGRLIFLLPSDFFEASLLRSRIFKLLNFNIEVEYKLGHLNYLEHDPLCQKLTVDSFFILKKGREKKYEHNVVNARLAGML